MLTVRFDELGVREGDLLLDMGCGAGRHAFECFRLGARVVAFDYSAAELKDVGGLFAAMREAGEAGTEPGAMAATTNGDALRLPFPDDTFDRIIASEVLEHVSDDQVALDEILRVLKPGGTLAATVPVVAARADLLGAVRRVPRALRRGRPRAHLHRGPPAGIACATPASGPAPPTAPTPCTRPTGGSSARSGPPTTTTRS